MAVAEVKMFFDNEQADDERLELFAEIRIDQSIGMAAEAEFKMYIGVDDSGNWSGMEEDFVQGFKRVRIEVKVQGGDFVPLIDGPIIAHRIELDAVPNQSHMTLVVQDDSVLLNQEEKAEMFEDLAPDQIAQQLFQEYGLSAEVDSVSLSSGGLERYVVQRGTAMQLLKKLAQQNGMFVYVKPDDSPGQSVGVFKRPDLSESDFPELVLLGTDRNINKFNVQFDALRPIKANAGSVDITNQNILTSTVEVPGLDAQGDEGVHDFVQVGNTLLARTREQQEDIDAATVTAVDHSSWAYSANAEIVGDNYPAVLSPHKTVNVVGAGGHLSGNWLISQVTHSLSDDGYTQKFTLRRNARSEGTGGGLLDALGSVF